jgi:hypothetical protein
MTIDNENRRLNQFIDDEISKLSKSRENIDLARDLKDSFRTFVNKNQTKRIIQPFLSERKSYKLNQMPLDRNNFHTPKKYTND